MSALRNELLLPRILVVDDERQIHASLRLRLGREHELVCCSDANDALQRVAAQTFDLCFVDIHMPGMNGLAFIEAARARDAALGYVVLSAFDNEDNLRRAIPLQVYDFLSKPLPDRNAFEARIPGWIAETRQRRQHRELAASAGTLANDLDAARLEREVELVASETARDALLQTANLLTTVHAHLVALSSSLAPRAKADASLAHCGRNLDEARRAAEAAMAVAEGFFDSAYGNRDASPALVESGVRHAVSIALRMTNAETRNIAIDSAGLHDRVPVRNLSGIDFLLMMVPVIGAALQFAAPHSTIRIDGVEIPRLDGPLRDASLRSHLWINRRGALQVQPGILVTVAAAGPALARAEAEAWLKGESAILGKLSSRGLVLGIQKCKGMLGLAIAPPSPQFRLTLALPT